MIIFLLLKGGGGVSVMVVSVCYILKLWTDCWSILNYTWHLAIVHAVIRDCLIAHVWNAVENVDILV